MNITVSFPEDQIDRFVAHVFRDQVPFATSRAINKTAIAFQRDQRAHMSDIFTIRRKQFMQRSVKIKPFSTKQRLEARISIDSPGGRSDIFGKFETETQKTPFRGNSLAVPSENVPRTPAGVIRKGWRPKDLVPRKGSQHGRGRVLSRRGDVFRGGQGTFLVRRPGGRGTIFQRTGAGVRVLYQLVPRVPIEPELDFVENAGRSVDREWQTQFTAAFDRAIRTAR